MPEFTQSKWIYDEPFGVIFSEETCAVIANVQGAGTGSCFCLTQEGQANARLIANAPEMYKLMKSVVDFDYGAFKFDTDGNLIFTREKYDEFRDLLAYIDRKEEKIMPEFTNGNKAGLIATCPVEDNARFITFAPEMYELLKEFARCEDYVDAAILGIEAEELLARIDGKDTGHDE